MKRFYAAGMSLLLAGAITTLQADDANSSSAVVVTASNAAQNQLLVYDTNARLLQTVSTQGQGGVSGNAGGIAS